MMHWHAWARKPDTVFGVAPQGGGDMRIPHEFICGYVIVDAPFDVIDLFFMDEPLTRKVLRRIPS